MEFLKTIDILNLVSGRKAYVHRNKSAIIKSMCLFSELSIEELSKYLGFSKEYVNNKIQRNSFSIDDLLIAAYASGFKLVLVNDSGLSSEIDICKYFKDEPGVLKRLEEEKKKRGEKL